MKFCIMLILLMNFTHAAIPTIEGLFRNPSNPDIDGDMIVLQIGIEEMKSDDNLDMETNKVTEIGKNENEMPEVSLLEKGYYKFIINKKQDTQNYEIIQISYNSANMKKSNVSGVNHFKKFPSLLKEEQLLSRNLFYSIITMYSLNSSAGMSDILSRYGVNFSRNQEIMNKEKVGLMMKYKSYLTTIKKNKDEKKDLPEIISPFKPEGEEESLKVKELLGQNMYNATTAISLTRKTKKFYWQVQLENIYALFSNTTHQLLYFELKDKENIYNVYFRDYVLFNGRHQFPKLIEFTVKNGKSYRIRFYKFSNFINKSKTMTERFKDYNLILEELQAKEVVKAPKTTQKPMLIL